MAASVSLPRRRPRARKGDAQISRNYGALASDEAGEETYCPHTLVLDPRLRVVGVFPFDDRPQTHVGRVVEFLDSLPRIGPALPAAVQAPVLVVPYLFEPE